ncbi:hypothetical protein JKP88DRAFT_266863 [Tribonema minus]|uniref:Uncharacterized protein n=1 Tax=Tribonema minus TaxID=303371 RepID=A0A835ZKA6_9STRA|nr:hypothetical protein JKP88DRAFT_266863 [Tribonema minus]
MTISKTSTLAACAAMVASSSAFVVPPMHSGSRPTAQVQMSAKHGGSAAAVVAAGILLQGALSAPVPADAAMFDAAPATSIQRAVVQDWGSAKQKVADVASDISGAVPSAADAVDKMKAAASQAAPNLRSTNLGDTESNQRWGDLAANAKTTVQDATGNGQDVNSKAQSLKNGAPDKVKSAASNVITSAVDPASPLGAGAINPLKSGDPSTLLTPNNAGGDSPSFQEGADVARSGAQNNIERARDTVNAEQTRKSGLQSLGADSGTRGTPSALNPRGAPSAKEGVAIAKAGVRDNAKRARDAVNDAKRGITQRDGAVDAVKDNARASAPFFGSQAQAGVNKLGKVLNN